MSGQCVLITRQVLPYPLFPLSPASAEELARAPWLPSKSNPSLKAKLDNAAMAMTDRKLKGIRMARTFRPAGLEQEGSQ